MTAAAVGSAYDQLLPLYGKRLVSDMVALPYERALISAFCHQVAATGLPGPVWDVGCGTGVTTAEIAAHGLEVVGMDASTQMLAAAAEQHPGLRFDHGDLHHLPAGDGASPGLVAWYSLVHLPSTALGPVLTEFARVVGQEGMLLLGFQTGTEVVAPAPEVDLRWHRHQVAVVHDQLTGSGWTVEATLTRGPQPGETSPQATIIARRSVSDGRGSDG